MASVAQAVAEQAEREPGTVTRVSFCRICSGGCGTIVSVGADGRIASIRGDRDNTLSRGYACFKGLQSGESHHGPERLIRPLARIAAGERREIGLEHALDAIAERLKPIVEQRGPESVAIFCGNGALLHATSFTMQRSFLAALGSRQFFTTLTIDQSAKLVSFGRLGAWAAGMPELGQMDVALMFGTNPLISHSSLGFLTADPVKRLKDARARGFKLVTVDPRMSETASQADLALQPLPGWDPAICAAMIRTLIDQGAYDASFCERFVGAEGMASLRAAVEPFTPEWVEQGARLNPGDIGRVCDMFAERKGFACAYGATGPNMAPFSNLAQHLIDTINVICGSFLREGDIRTQTIVQDPFNAPVAAVIGGDRPWEQEPPSRIRGAGMFYGERLSATLPEEILTPGDGQIRALIVIGGDPATSLPDQAKAVEALRSLELLVSIDPFLGPTASLADFVLPPLMQYERTDVTAQIPGYPLWPGCWAQYAAPVVDPPAGSDLADDWYFLWGLAKRLGLQISYGGKRMLDMTAPPETDDLIRIQLDGAVASLDDLKASLHGIEHDLGQVRVLAAEQDDVRRFDVMPADVADELEAFLAEKRKPPATNAHAFLLAVRRMRDFFNSNGMHNRRVRQRNPYNPVFVHPEDLQMVGIADGGPVSVRSDHGSVDAIVRADASMRRGVVALTHGWGRIGEMDPAHDGSCVNRLISANLSCESINAMPHMSGLPVTLAPR